MTYPLPTNIDSTNHAGLDSHDHESFHDTVHSTSNYLRVGSGSPEGSVTADVGTLYIDTSGGVPYMKQTGTGNTGWAVLHSTSTYVRVGTGTPEGSVTATIGTIYLDTTNGALYMKESGAGNTGWVPISTRATEENSAHTIGPTDRIVNVDTSGGSVVITLPDNAGDSGHAFIVRRDGGSTVTINRAGSDTFDDGHTQKTLDSDGAAIGLFSIGDTEWKIVATEGTVGGS